MEIPILRIKLTAEFMAALRNAIGVQLDVGYVDLFDR